jgi:hypothetical protein
MKPVQILKTVLALIIVIFFYAIISDWPNFKAGFTGSNYIP